MHSALDDVGTSFEALGVATESVDVVHYVGVASTVLARLVRGVVGVTG
jgi:hypothetical protein